MLYKVVDVLYIFEIIEILKFYNYQQELASLIYLSLKNDKKGLLTKCFNEKKFFKKKKPCTCKLILLAWYEYLFLKKKIIINVFNKNKKPIKYKKVGFQI